MSMTPTEQAEAAMNAQHEAARETAQAYKRLFATKDGQRVLEELRTLFPHDRARFDAKTAFAQPLAAFMGGVHFDGSAMVTKHILDRIAEASAKQEQPPTVTTA